jgi:hypothetical protein
VPSIPAKTALPGAGWSRLDRNRAEGFGDLGQPAAGHLEDADLVGGAEAVLDRAQDAELVAALAFEIKDGIDHVFDHAGAGDLAVLGDMADQDDRHAARLAKVTSSCAAARTWLTEPGAASTVSSHMVWIESMIARAGRSASSVVRMSRRLVSAPAGPAASPRPKPLRPHPHLGAGLLARDIQAFQPLAGETGGACKSSVDLPMPGSPPTRMAEAGTSPPPSTRSSSSIPDEARGGGASSVARSVSGITRPLAPSALGPVESGASSTMVFQPPQASHLPGPFAMAAPQAVQVKEGAALFHATAWKGPHQARIPPQDSAKASGWGL